MKGASRNEKRQDVGFVEKVAGNIRRFRIQNGYTQEKLRFETGLSISRCESGRHDMNLTTLSILSRHLNVEPFELLK